MEGKGTLQLNKRPRQSKKKSTSYEEYERAGPEKMNTNICVGYEPYVGRT